MPEDAKPADAPDLSKPLSPPTVPVKRIRFTMPDSPYAAGMVAEFSDFALADSYIARGTAVDHEGDGAAPSADAFGKATQPVGPVHHTGRAEAYVNDLPATVVTSVDDGSGKPESGPGIDKPADRSAEPKDKPELGKDRPEVGKK